MDFISIIVPVYRGECYIDRLIQMFDKAAVILHQVHPEVSVRISFINDNPELEIRESEYVRPEHIFSSFFNPGIHQGIHGTRIYGLEHSDSVYVVFFDQDDFIEDSYLLNQYEKINSADAVYDGVVCNGVYRGNRLIYSESRPMEKTFDRKALLEKQCNPLSPGQVMIRRKSIPVKMWGRYILRHNLTDDWLLWFLMVHQGCSFRLNPDVLYTHGEDGTNSSQNWKEMGQSRVELLEVLRKLEVLTSEEDAVFCDRTENYLKKYERYIQLDELMEQADREQLMNGIRKITAEYRIAIYGIGVYGQLLHRLLTEAHKKIDFFIDQHAEAVKGSDVPVYNINEEHFPETDMIIVTPLFAYEEILRTTLKDIKCNKIGMDEFVRKCLVD